MADGAAAFRRANDRERPGRDTAKSGNGAATPANTGNTAAAANAGDATRAANYRAGPDNRADTPGGRNNTRYAAATAATHADAATTAGIAGARGAPSRHTSAGFSGYHSTSDGA